MPPCHPDSPNGTKCKSNLFSGAAYCHTEVLISVTIFFFLTDAVLDIVFHYNISIILRVFFSIKLSLINWLNTSPFVVFEICVLAEYCIQQCWVWDKLSLSSGSGTQHHLLVWSVLCTDMCSCFSKLVQILCYSGETEVLFRLISLGKKRFMFLIFILFVLFVEVSCLVFLLSCLLQ